MPARWRGLSVGRVCSVELELGAIVDAMRLRLGLDAELLEADADRAPAGDRPIASAREAISRARGFAIARAAERIAVSSVRTCCREPSILPEVLMRQSDTGERVTEVLDFPHATGCPFTRSASTTSRAASRAAPTSTRPART